MTTIEPHVDEFLSQTLVGVISTVDAQGRPCSAPIWYQWEDGAAFFFTGRRTLKWAQPAAGAARLSVRRLAGAAIQVGSPERRRRGGRQAAVRPGALDGRPILRRGGGTEVREDFSRRGNGLGSLPSDSDASSGLYGGRLGASRRRSSPLSIRIDWRQPHMNLTREDIHRMVDSLPECDIPAVGEYLQSLQTADSDALLNSLMAAPWDDDAGVPRRGRRHGRGLRRCQERKLGKRRRA